MDFAALVGKDVTDVAVVRKYLHLLDLQADDFDQVRSKTSLNCHVTVT